MKKITRSSIIFLSIFTLALINVSSGCIMAGGIKGNGKVISDERNVSNFEKIQVGGAFNVFLTQGDKEYLRIEAEENLMSYIKSEVIGGKLKIYSDKNLNPTKEMKIYLTFKNLEDIDISGACELKGENRFTLDELEMEVSGAAEIFLELELNELDANFSGASEVELKGKAGEVEIDISGAGELEAGDFETESMEISISGAADAKIFVTKSLNVFVSGAASVKYKGNPSVSTNVSGAGSVSHF